MPNGTGDDSPRVDYLHDDLMREYDRIADTVAAFDQRLLTIKSWGVTFSLATLALGFQQDHYGLFMVAAAAALGFWLIEGSTKSHQLRYYPRMRDIEAIAYERYGVETANATASSPLIDWSWHTAAQRIWGLPSRRVRWSVRFPRAKPPDAPPAEQNPHVPTRWADVSPEPGGWGRVLLWPHVALPHAIAFVLGIVLFVLGLAGAFGPI